MYALEANLADTLLILGHKFVLDFITNGHLFIHIIDVSVNRPRN